MGDVIRNSISVIITSNGFSCQHSLYISSTSSCGDRLCRTTYHNCCCRSLAIKLNRRRVRVRGLEVTSLPVNGRAWLGSIQLKILPMDTLSGSSWMDSSHMVSNMVATIESKMVSEEKEDETNSVIRERKDLLPPWGDLVFGPPSDIEPRSVSQSPSVLENVVTALENQNKTHFLEETDEEELSRRMLMLSRSNKVRSALELHKSMELAGLRPNVHGCNSLLSCLLRNKRLDDALRVFSFMKKNEITTGHTYSLVLKAVASTQGYEAALGIFAESEGYSIHKDFDVIVYNTIIAICARVNNWVETERIWTCMKESGVIGTRVTYSLLVCTFVRCCQNELAIDAYNEMLQSGLKPGSDTMQAVISACSKEGKWDLSLNVFQSMLKNGLKPNQVAWNSVINCLGKAGKVNLAFKVYDNMTNMGYQPDEYTWNALLCALYRANRLSDSIHFFESIKREQNSQLNIHMYNTVLTSCQKLGSWERALQLLWQMETSGLSVPTASYNLVIGACETARKPKVALQVFEHMVHRKCSPDTFTHLSLIRSCVWGSLWNKVEEILDQVASDPSLYNAAIQGMCLRGRVESARGLYTRMCKNGLKPDGKTWALMLQNLQKYPKRKKGYLYR
ncbi:PPR domain-containing protein/PPR_2 domain-containing protein/PPR_3 domain-containing protein [Cephalotus follicularis]|uniref:PPR domain-containing protein/PPR_2 domain-containing protein/PPR_3 domain-containing protein n=1 Tax=Cephalotus follicularis TaxID=3775 RepID=A0A1Q3BD57_CEPFO|nr:PPR domain-containing protein/PPR_2 domain-containing protein/PPR_3 domain-containing protein [Cephalotus follicularis]